jgi:DNA polymerase-3 subunit epsilon
MDYCVLVTDTESAGLDGGVCDIAIAEIDANFNVVAQVESLINPERPIRPSASGVHHITDDMVASAPTLAQYLSSIGDPFLDDKLVIAGHNIGFDCRMLTGHMPERYLKLDTLRLARNFWPDEVEDHKLQTLRYTFRLEAGPAHRAMGDVVTCISLLRHMARTFDLSLEELIEKSRRPLTLDAKMTFGKHKGEKLRDLDGGYVHWLLTKSDNLDPDVREALEQHPTRKPTEPADPIPF